MGNGAGVGPGYRRRRDRTVICGSHVTDVLPTSDAAENAVMGAAREPGVPGVNVPVPVVAIALPGS